MYCNFEYFFQMEFKRRMFKDDNIFSSCMCLYIYICIYSGARYFLFVGFFFNQMLDD